MRNEDQISRLFTPASPQLAAVVQTDTLDLKLTQTLTQFALAVKIAM
jgi:hypothetical protein